MPRGRPELWFLPKKPRSCGTRAIYRLSFGRKCYAANGALLLQDFFHFLHRRHFNLANALGAHAIFRSQIMQREAA
jgi:hypothetical protein